MIFCGELYFCVGYIVGVMGDIRNSKITRVSIVGILTNVCLASFKAVVGLMAHSIAVILDAVNNLSDALSSVITIVGVKLAGRKPDREHPFGHGRVEYFTAIVISALVFAAGVTSFVESVKKIIKPEASDYSWITVLVITVAIVTKLILGRYVKKRGIELNSDALVASGADASFDAILSAATLLAAAISMIWGVNVDGYIGAVISGFIVKAGIELLLDPMSRVVGKRAQSDLSRAIKSEIANVDGVTGVFDLILHDYGPSIAIGSVHVEVADDISAVDVHRITRRIHNLVYDKFKIVLTVGIYAKNGSDSQVMEMESFARKTALAHEGVMQLHGFLVDEGLITFDVVIAFKYDQAAICAEISEAIQSKYPGYSLSINVDTDYSD